jgi:hypothetical protein
MSFDIILLQFESDLESLNDLADEEAQALGDSASIRRAITAAFDEASWRGSKGLLVCGEAYALEISIPDEELPESVHFSLKFGTTWKPEGDRQFHARLETLCSSNGWQAFAVSDNSRVA